MRSEVYKRQFNTITSAAINKSVMAGKANDMPTATSLLDTGELQKKMLSLIIPYSKSLKGTSLWYQQLRKELFTILSCDQMPVPVPSYFLTLSSGDKYWKQLYQQIDTSLFDEKGEWNLNVDEKTRINLLRNNSVKAVLHFYDRFDAFRKIFLEKNPESPVGEIVDYFFRVEFQARGSLHIHGLLWCAALKHAAQLLKSTEGQQEIKTLLENFLFSTLDPCTILKLPQPTMDDFIRLHTNHYNNDNPPIPLSNEINNPPIIHHMLPSACEKNCQPNYCPHSNYKDYQLFHQAMNHPNSRDAPCKSLSDAETLQDLFELIKANQVHTCQKTCWKKCKAGNPLKCRFNFPKDQHEEFLVEVTEKIVATGSVQYTLKCDPSRFIDVDEHVNNYNPLFLLCWRANIDLQVTIMIYKENILHHTYILYIFTYTYIYCYILSYLHIHIKQYCANPYGAAVYVCKYITKD